jgi:hypothetical protein
MHACPAFSTLLFGGGGEGGGYQIQGKIISLCTYKGAYAI